ncbi:endonuclease/exonuclease/phosphatase family protein [Polaribacter sp. Z022]|uniref:endonuclease/exonuclease/phosphatase family protein n=1 Tax=Polaribacter sp. Z022 TaxID=2927125 RepID=UPI002021B649|nr:endonuclease/exonuclease/phosphatase family protein [Polaribacter sp. Z022]MCL7753092.1 endonuclease/exonuclease/phosphatase family protein [Polaribacter sp. Z022]
MSKIKYFLALILFTSCEDFSLFQRDQENILFSKNIKSSSVFDENILIATFNMKLGFCQNCDPFSGELGGNHQQLDRIVEMINQMNLDIVTLQEVGYEYDTSIIENQIKYIAEKTNMNYSYGMGRVLQTGNNLFLKGYIGNAILSKYEITDIDNPAVRYIDYYNQNHCLKVKLKLSESKEITILNTHFESGSTNDEKILQIHRIKEIAQGIDTPIIFTGDLNLPYSINNFYLEMLNFSFFNSLEKIDTNERQSVVNTGTFINGSVLDYIYFDKNNFTVLSGKLAPQEYRDISDHFLYKLQLKIK